MTALQLSPWLFVGAVFVLGLIIGSFLNVVIYRVPIMMERCWREQCAELAGQTPEGEGERFNLLVPRSRCPDCGHQITALENVPVVSWLWLRGKCSSCGGTISARYPIIEFCTGLASALVAWRFGYGVEALAALGLTWALIALSAIDIDRQWLPDQITLPVLWLGLVLSLFHATVDGRVLFIEPGTAIIGAAAGYLSLWSVYHVFRLATGKEGMGYGDFKLLALLGAWLGWQFLPMIIILSAGVGAVVGIALIVLRNHKRDVPIPFGPYLAAAGWLALLFGPELLTRYLHLSGLA